MAYLDIDPRRFAFLLNKGTHQGELKKFFVESRAQLLMKGAKVQNVPHGREERIRTICDRLHRKTDEVLRLWFFKNIFLTAPAPIDELLLYLGAYFEEGEPLPEAEAQTICRSALVALFSGELNEDLLRLLRGSRENSLAPDEVSTRGSIADDDPDAIDGLLSSDIAPSPIKSAPESFQISELIASVMLNDEVAIDNALSPFGEGTQLLVEALLRLREGNADAAREKLSSLEVHGPESELVRSALARASHVIHDATVPAGIRTLIPEPLRHDPDVIAYEIIGIYTNESDTGAVFVDPIYLVLDGKPYELSNDDRVRLFPDSGSVMTHRTILRRQLSRREFVHWKVSERDGPEGRRTRFHLVDELPPLREIVSIDVPSGDADEVRSRIKTYASNGRFHASQQMMFLLSDGVVVGAPKGVDLMRDEAFESPWQAWASLDTWLIEGHQFSFGALSKDTSHVDLSPLDVSFRRLLKNLDAEQRLAMTKAQRSELSARLRGQTGGEIAQRAKRIAASIDQLSINADELDAVLNLLDGHAKVHERVDELVAKEYEARQSERAGLQEEVSALRRRKSELERVGRDIERVNQTKLSSVAASVQEVFAIAIREGASTLAKAEVFRVLTGGIPTTSQAEALPASTGPIDEWIKPGDLSEADIKARLSTLGINARQAFMLSSLLSLAAAVGIPLLLRGEVARQCAKALARRDGGSMVIVDIPMGLTSGAFLTPVVECFERISTLALLNADLSPLEVYGAALLDLLVERVVTGASDDKVIVIACLGGELSLPIPGALRRMCLIVDLDSTWDDGSQTLEDVDPDSLLLLPALREKLFGMISNMDAADRRHIEGVFVRAVLRA